MKTIKELESALRRYKYNAEKLSEEMAKNKKKQKEANDIIKQLSEIKSNILEKNAQYDMKNLIIKENISMIPVLKDSYDKLLSEKNKLDLDSETIALKAFLKKCSFDTKLEEISPEQLKLNNKKIIQVIEMMSIKENFTRDLLSELNQKSEIKRHVNKREAINKALKVVEQLDAIENINPEFFDTKIKELKEIRKEMGRANQQAGKNIFNRFFRRFGTSKSQKIVDNAIKMIKNTKKNGTLQAKTPSKTI